MADLGLKNKTQITGESALQTTGYPSPTHSVNKLPQLAVTIVVPCYNERESLATLFENLTEVENDLSDKYEVHILLVDDGSTDGTWPPLMEVAGERTGWTAIQHKENQGIAGAIMTGISAAKTDIVCSVDADCSYALCQLEKLIPMLTENVGMVTASPYHPDGKVVDVPRWRILVSKMCSRSYRLVLRNKLHTYTSCFRVYRREAVLPIELNNNGFAGVAELLIQLDERGNQIVECPAVLASRVTGIFQIEKCFPQY